MGASGDKIKGKANELAGKVTGNRTKQMKGKAQQAKGGLKDEFEAEKARTRDEVRGDRRR
jgi:uncharacterized protein YjbJ (UPF0337 family)